MKTIHNAWVLVWNKTDRQVLLAERSKKVNNPKTWNFFGGGVDLGETYSEAAQRELMEEAGIKVTRDKLKPLLLIKGIKPKKNVITAVFCYVVDKPIEPLLNEEHRQFAWVKPKKLSNFPLHRVTQAVSRIIWANKKVPSIDLLLKEDVPLEQFDNMRPLSYDDLFISRPHEVGKQKK